MEGATNYIVRGNQPSDPFKSTTAPVRVKRINGEAWLVQINADGSESRICITRSIVDIQINQPPPVNITSMSSPSTQYMQNPPAAFLKIGPLAIE